MADHPLPDGVVLRPATAEDLPAVQALLRDANLPREGVEAQFGESYVLAVRPGGSRPGRIVGAAGLEVYGREGLLRSLVVVPPLRGLGLGLVLAEDRLARARALGLSSVWLLTTTAAPFFERFGFASAERGAAGADLAASPEFAGACPASATCMRLAFD